MIKWKIVEWKIKKIKDDWQNRIEIIIRIKFLFYSLFMMLSYFKYTLDIVLFIQFY